MKRMKKLVGLLLTMVMVLSMTMTAFADETYSITINNTAKGHTYEAYQIFTGDLSGQANPDAADGTNAVLSNIKWGSGITDAGKTALLSFGIEEGGKAYTDAAALAEKLNAGNAKEFALAAEKYLTATPTSNVTVAADAEGAASYVISGLTPGYYLIKDKDNSLNDKYESYTSFILEVVENSTVTPKSDIPSVEKKVDDVNDSNNTEDGESWQDSADYDIGDAVPFKLTGTLPSNYSEYVKYTMTFHDTLPAGLDQPVIKSVYLADANGVKVKDFAATDYKYDATNTGFKITFADLKECSLKAMIDDSMKIVVEYTSVLNEKAAVGAAGNLNKVKLEFSNDPNFDGIGEPETGETPEDTVIVFTYQVNVDKYKDEVKDGNELGGAEFTLYKYDPKNEDALTEGEWEGYVALEMVKAESGTEFSFAGLDDGDYVLVESVTPVGYNTMDPVYFTVTATHDITSDNPQLTDLNGNVTTGKISFTKDVVAGSLSTDVVNLKGATLPETGGMGTTLFYVFGTILVAGAAVMLITKKRMNNAR